MYSHEHVWSTPELLSTSGVANTSLSALNDVYYHRTYANIQDSTIMSAGCNKLQATMYLSDMIWYALVSVQRTTYWKHKCIFFYKSPAIG